MVDSPLGPVQTRRFTVDCRLVDSERSAWAAANSRRFTIDHRVIDSRQSTTNSSFFPLRMINGLLLIVYSRWLMC
jgi:hypothetical protein